MDDTSPEPFRFTQAPPVLPQVLPLGASSVFPMSASDRQALASLVAAVDAGVRIDGDALQLGRDTWAVHGNVAYDGEIIVAEFDDPASARWAVEQQPPWNAPAFDTGDSPT